MSLLQTSARLFLFVYPIRQLSTGWFCSDSIKDAGEDSPTGGVAIAVKILQFYKREFLLSQTIMYQIFYTFRSAYLIYNICEAYNILSLYSRTDYVLCSCFVGEISPLIPGSCRFVPTCSEYGMQAFKKYGVVKGAILTAWRLSRCNPLGVETLRTPTFQSYSISVILCSQITFPLLMLY